MDTEIGVALEPEDDHGTEKTLYRKFKLKAVKLARERGVSAAQACRDLDRRENVLRNWMRQQSANPKSLFLGHGQM
ncbi:MAG: transposase [Tagaea sp.]